MFLFQLATTPIDSALVNDAAVTPADFFQNPVLNAALWTAGIAAVLVGVLYLVRWVVRLSRKLPTLYTEAVLLVTVPKESLELEQRERGTGREPKELIGVAETLYANLSGLKQKWSPGVFFFGRQDHFSLEIVADHGLISFYVAVPRRWQDFVEKQIHAQYPHAHIEPVEDYNIFQPQGAIEGCYLTLSKSQMFPLRTYKKLESDPMNALTNALSRFGEHEGAAIQIVCRGASARWRMRGRKIAREMQQGKKLEQAMGAQNVFGKLGKAWEVAMPKVPTQHEIQMRQWRQTQPYRLSPMEEELVKALDEKASKIGFEVNVRLIVSSPDAATAKLELENLVNTFYQYTAQESGVSFKKVRSGKTGFIRDFIFRNFAEPRRFVLNTEELTSIFHLPLPQTETPNIRWLAARGAPAPANIPRAGLLIGSNRYRGLDTPIRIKPEDRRRHVYIIGVTGSGKSVLMSEMAKQDIRNGAGVCIVDPHGSLVEDILPSIPKERLDDVVLFDPSDTDRPIGLNMLEADTPEQADFACQEMISIFYKLVTDPSMIGPMFEHNMRNAMLTLMADRQEPGTIAEIPRIFTDPEFQRYKVGKLRDPMVRAFWEKEMAKTSDFHKSEMLGYLISKVGRFVENEMVRNIIGQSSSGFSFREVMDQGKILLVNLSKGKVGEVNANLLGLIIVSKLQMAALARADLPEQGRKDFYLYVDEFQNFITDSIATILAEARKYRLNLTMAHQYIGQLVNGQDTKIRDAVFGNVGTQVCFRIGVEDAEVMAKQFAPVFDEYDVINIPRYTAYVRLLIDNSASRPFNVATLPPTVGDPAITALIRERSRQRYGRDKQEVEAEILKRARLGGAPAAQGPSLERNL